MERLSVVKLQHPIDADARNFLDVGIILKNVKSHVYNGTIVIQPYWGSYNISKPGVSLYVDLSELDKSKPPYVEGCEEGLTHAWLSRAGAIVVAHGIGRPHRSKHFGHYLPDAGAVEIDEHGLVGILMNRDKEPQLSLIDEMDCKIGTSKTFVRSNGAWRMDGKIDRPRGFKYDPVVTLSTMYRK